MVLAAHQRLVWRQREEVYLYGVFLDPSLAPYGKVDGVLFTWCPVDIVSSSGRRSFAVASLSRQSTLPSPESRVLTQPSSHMSQNGVIANLLKTGLCG